MNATFGRASRFLGAALFVPALLFAGAGPAAAADGGVVQHEISFTVQNINSTDVKCAADGKTYQIRGHLTAPVQALSSPGAVTLLLHGLSYGEFFGDYTAQDGYNFAEAQAEAGHAVVTIDRLGYGASDQPAGSSICFGSQATMAHEMIGDLKTGKYALDGTPSPSFPQVILAGHSVGGMITQIEGSTFHDADALAVLSYSDTVVSLAAQTAPAQATQACQAGGTLKNGTSGAPGYIYFGADTPEQFIEAHFYPMNADPAVVNTTASLRSRDPCGDVQSYKAAAAVSLAGVPSITTPTLVMIGERDAIYSTPATTQAALFTHDTKVTAITIPDTGHALVLHLSAPTVRADFSKWLVDSGFGGMVMPTGAADTGGGGASPNDTALIFVLGAGLLLVSAVLLLIGTRRRPTRSN